MGQTLFRICAALVGLGLLLAALALAFVYRQGTSPPRGTPRYVALGSSYAAGPSLVPRASDSPLLCGRSGRNYAHLLADRRGYSLVDVSCSGATTEHVLHGGQYFQPAQIDAVGPETRLVTATIGGNDVFYLGNLAAFSCGASPSLIERILGSCRPIGDAAVAQGFVRLRRNLRAIIAEVHRRAPRARLVFVNYLTVLPVAGTCARLGLTYADTERMRAVATRLAQTTSTAAHDGGAEVLDAAQLSRGHDVCSVSPWLNGRHPPGPGLSAPLHPNPAGMEAIAVALDKALG